jgi:hypothetical protein
LLSEDFFCKRCVNIYFKEYCKQTVQDFVLPNPNPNLNPS